LTLGFAERDQQSGTDRGGTDHRGHRTGDGRSSDDDAPDDGRGQWPLLYGIGDQVPESGDAGPDGLRVEDDAEDAPGLLEQVAATGQHVFEGGTDPTGVGGQCLGDLLQLGQFALGLLEPGQGVGTAGLVELHRERGHGRFGFQELALQVAGVAGRLVQVAAELVGIAGRAVHGPAGFMRVPVDGLQFPAEFGRAPVRCC
jgi:hypothetical protein